MAVFEGGVSGLLAGVAEEAQKAIHVAAKPIPFGTGGHYSTSHDVSIVATQAANSRIWEMKNVHASMLIIPTKLTIRWIQTGAHTAAIRDDIEIFRVTGFTAVDTVNTVTLTTSKARTSMPSPVAAAFRGVTVAGAAAGMTGGTMIKDGNTIGDLHQWLLAAQPTASTVLQLEMEMFDDICGAHPFVFAQNEGLVIENSALLGAAASSSVSINFSWCETTVF